MFHWEAMGPVPGALAGREPDPFPKGCVGKPTGPFPFPCIPWGGAAFLGFGKGRGSRFGAGALAAVGDGASLSALSSSRLSRRLLLFFSRRVVP